jgi:hypothetical protein
MKDDFAGFRRGQIRISQAAALADLIKVINPTRNLGIASQSTG